MVSLMLPLLIVSVLVASRPVFGQGFDLEFNTDGVLPSSQGATYISSTNTPEAAAFSVSGGILHQNTNQFGSDVEAWYDVQNSYDPNLPATLELSARVIRNDLVTADFYLYAGDPNNRRELDFNLAPNGIQYNLTASSGFVTIVPMDTTDALHSYRVVVPAGMSAFQLFVDGALKYSGNPLILNNEHNEFPDSVGWGDGSPDGGNATVDWNYVRLTNTAVPSVVPESGSLALLGSGMTGLGLLALRRRKRAA